MKCWSINLDHWKTDWISGIRRYFEVKIRALNNMSDRYFCVVKRWVILKGSKERRLKSLCMLPRTDFLSSPTACYWQCLGGMVTFIIPRASGGYVVGKDCKFSFLDWDSGQLEVVAEVDQGMTNKTNDAKCDASGRLWAGQYELCRRIVGGIFRHVICFYLSINKILLTFTL